MIARRLDAQLAACFADVELAHGFEFDGTDFRPCGPILLLAGRELGGTDTPGVTETVLVPSFVFADSVRRRRSGCCRRGCASVQRGADQIARRWN